MNGWIEWMDFQMMDGWIDGWREGWMDEGLRQV